jgi:hypothetical protein
MAFAATASTKEPRSFSIGPLKIQILTYTAADNDVAGTVTASALNEVFHIIVDGGMVLTAAPTFSGKVATLAFADPGAGGLFGTILCIGR